MSGFGFSRRIRRCVDCANWSDSEFFLQTALMSKAFLNFQAAFVGFIAVLQLALLPATYVLHVGCGYAHGNRPSTSASAAQIAFGWFASSHCCDHCSQRSNVADDQPTDSDPVHPPHDEDSCPVCQAAFAARMATVATVDLNTTNPVCDCITGNSQAVNSTPRYSVLSRGPPTASFG